MEWHIVAFPLILPWREDFWTLPLFFPDLKVGVTLGWPPQLPYQGQPLPPEAQAPPPELKYYHPGDLRQWQAFQDYQEGQAEGSDLLQALRNYGQVQGPLPEASPQGWSLAWQLEKLQADQEAQLGLVDRGEAWLKEILTPEPWEERPGFGAPTEIPEMVPPDLARLRYALWREVLASYLQDSWAPFLLGRTSRALFLTLQGWPEWTGLQRVQFTLPGIHTAEEWLTVCPDGAPPPWQAQAVALLNNLLDEADDLQNLKAAVRELGEFLRAEVLPQWPYPVMGNFEMEVWVPASEDQTPVLCWTSAGGSLPDN